MISKAQIDIKPDPVMATSLVESGLIHSIESASFEALTGGVSSDIWKVTGGQKVFCVKRALPKLKVAADWLAPVERNRYEVCWYRTANSISKGSAPEILMHDEKNMLFAMEFLDPKDHKLWKSELRDGRADPGHARLVGRTLARIHSQTAYAEDIRQLFPPNNIFYEIRLEPYLEATVEKHPDLSKQLFALSKLTNETRIAMIHGDVSPKNILLGPEKPVFLDAECACIGDPAFDIAFCLNHFLLKCLWTPSAQDGFLACFEAMTRAYLAEVDWEPADELEARAASLLPGLLLARVDGKSPVEYITKEDDKEKIRRVARALLFNPPGRMLEISGAWEKELYE